MIKIFLTLLLLLTALFGQTQTSTFKSFNYGYAINKPNIFEKIPAKGIHIDFKVVNKSDGSSILVNVSKRLPEEEGIDAHDYSREYFQTIFHQTAPNTIISKTEKITVDGKKTFLIYYSYPSSTGNTLKVIEAYLFVGDNAYVITTTSDAQNYETHKSIFLETIKSIKFK